jgi:hypothetical protein
LQYRISPEAFTVSELYVPLLVGSTVGREEYPGVVSMGEPGSVKTAAE